MLIIMGDPGFVKWFLQKLGKLERIFLGNWVMAYARADSRQFSAGSVVPGSEAPQPGATAAASYCGGKKAVLNKTTGQLFISSLLLRLFYRSLRLYFFPDEGYTPHSARV